MAARAQIPQWTNEAVEHQSTMPMEVVTTQPDAESTFDSDTDSDNDSSVTATDISIVSADCLCTVSDNWESDNNVVDHVFATREVFVIT